MLLFLWWILLKMYGPVFANLRANLNKSQLELPSESGVGCPLEDHLQKVMEVATMKLKILNFSESKFKQVFEKLAIKSINSFVIIIV